jgi:predicted SAM-dependent methyltransferase
MLERIPVKKKKMTKLPYLNLGCGSTCNNAWTNVDFVSTGPGVIAHNLLSGIPFGDNSFEVVYHSHVLEHFPKEKAKDFIKECYRVLKKDGIIRIAIPDLERIARNYLKYMEESLEGKPGAAQKYDWTMLEMYDQVVRNNSGGEMVEYIKDESRNNDEFLLERNGKEVRLIIDNLRKKEEPSALVEKPQSNPFFHNFGARVKNKLIRMLLKEDYAALNNGRFRLQGEIHQWMYDRYSLKVLLESCGFKDVQVKGAFDSSIPDWKTFELDGSNEVVRKPDSLFAEARK